ncbi:hypothetical protein, partial [Cyanobium sp. L1E-Cus]|uniref:hypothetical protein n=1 Tax=Cyanobium sp. L1E-Cus TaxID=2823714 RepID=UPI0020CC9B15
MTIIIILYSLIQAFEFGATLARLSGVLIGQPLLGYSIQQVIYMGTRLVLVLMIPLLGYMVDMYPNPEGFRQMTSMALMASGIAGALLLFGSRNISSYFVSVIRLYAIKKNLTASFLQAFFNTSSKDATIYIPTLCRVASSVNTRKTLALSIGVFSLYSTGLFLAFYLSVIFPSN